MDQQGKQSDQIVLRPDSAPQISGQWTVGQILAQAQLLQNFVQSMSIGQPQPAQNGAGAPQLEQRGAGQ